MCQWTKEQLAAVVVDCMFMRNVLSIGHQKVIVNLLPSLRMTELRVYILLFTSSTTDWAGNLTGQAVWLLVIVFSCNWWIVCYAVFAGNSVVYWKQLVQCRCVMCCHRYGNDERRAILEEQAKNNAFHRFIEGKAIIKQGFLDKRKVHHCFSHIRYVTVVRTSMLQVLFNLLTCLHYFHLLRFRYPISFLY